MAADSGQKNIDIVGTASMNTYDVAFSLQSQLDGDISCCHV